MTGIGGRFVYSKLGRVKHISSVTTKLSALQKGENHHGYEWYPPHMKRGIVQRECECVGCKEATFWRYDHTKKYERIFFAVCSSDCFNKILQSGLRNPTGEILKLVEPKKIAMRAIEREF
jgi:hypothetical protein